MDPSEEAFTEPTDDDFRVVWFSGTGAGGQHRNKNMNSCRVTHIPTGTTEMRQSRSRDSNLKEAKEALIRRMRSQSSASMAAEASVEKKGKLGSGMRGDKFITLQFQNDRATNHKTGKSCRVRDWMEGKMDLIW